MISEKEVKKIAGMAKLEFKKNEIVQIQKEMNDVLKYMEKLNETDTSAIEPLSIPFPQNLRLREDEILPSLEKKDVIKNAPETDGDFFLVPGIK